jgi:hypothetical protein
MLTSPQGERIQVSTDKPTNAKGKTVVNHLEEKPLENIKVVCEYPDVFLEELLGMPQAPTTALRTPATAALDLTARSLRERMGRARVGRKRKELSVGFIEERGGRGKDGRGSQWASAGSS